MLYNMCKLDPLFFVNFAGVIYEPRTPRVLPFITYDFQDQTLLAIDAAIGKCDVGIEKSRDMGMSWIVLTLFTWRWLFYPYQSFLLVSRTQDLVDKTDDSDSLMWKIDFLIKHLPRFMRPKIDPNKDRSNMHLRNPHNNSLTDGTSTTGDIARGGRRTAELLDENGSFSLDDGYKALSSTQASTDTRIFLSTPQGAVGAYYDVMHDPHMEMVRLRLHWQLHPLKRPGLYTSDEDGDLRILDKAYWRQRLKERGLNPDPLDLEQAVRPLYDFICDKKTRSPWYDRECRRCPLPSLIAQELDIDYTGSKALFFNREMLVAAEKRDARPPLHVGEIEYEPDTAEPIEGFIDKAMGLFRLWAHLDAHGRLARDRNYVMGCDIATGNADNDGAGASNSTMTLGDEATGELIGKIATTGMDPYTFAKLCVAVARWAVGEDGNGAFMVWEANGPGRQFGGEVIRLGYRYIYYREAEDSIKKKRTLFPGWWSTTETKKTMLGEYARAMAAGECINRDAISIRECESYVVMPNQSIEHIGGLGEIDPTGARENHGDRVIADGLCWKGIRRHFVSVRSDDDDDDDAMMQNRAAPPDSVKHRMELVTTEQKKEGAW